MGKVDDGTIAGLVGVSRGVVGAFRRMLGIPAYEGYKWSTTNLPTGGGRKPKHGTAPHAPRGDARFDGILDKLGRIPDHEAGSLIGVSAAVVLAYRRKHKIPAYKGYLFQPGHPSHRTPAETSRLKAPAAVAKSARHSANDALIAPHAQLLGTVADGVLAKQLGIPTNAVSSYRKRHEYRVVGVQARGRGRPRGSRLDEFRDIVGFLRDAEVARRSGMTREAVRLYRKRLGIPSALERHGAAVRLGTTWAWKISVLVGGEEVVRYALTEDAGAAAALGEQVGEVVGVERVGEGLEASAR
jgi:hypothetical protein